ncbi:MAG: DUF3786 domain-containing protein [Desulfobacteraceae bacterium]|nr:MAG: DUF3786 domain-containing protein [Desulfobacteraceae bacterium]
MVQLNNPMEILKLLDKSNCRKCNEATCLAFAAAVARGQRALNECPSIEEAVIKRFGGEHRSRKSSDRNVEEVLDQLKGRLRTIDLAASAKRLNTPFKDGILTLKVCGKDFSVDLKGNFSSEIHIHSWLTLPVLNYILEGEGAEPSGKWVPFRELKGGKEWIRFFEHRCEKPMKKVADSYPDFFADMLHIFAGKQVERQFDSDISLVLYPLLKVPILICYWRPEDGLESDFHLFFDLTAENNLNIDSIYLLTNGLAIMFEKIALRHN